MKRKLFLLLLSLFLFSSVFAQSKAKSQENYNIVKEGKGMSGITIGRSSMDDVIKKFGKEYKWIVNKKYSFQMNYYRLGLAFYICQSDKKKQVFVMEIKAPYKAKTSKGIILGKSTLEEVQKKYGKLKSGLEYRGVSFYYNKVDGKNIITEIDITENSGIRQCKVGK
jgi:hypothetical protein